MPARMTAACLVVLGFGVLASPLSAQIPRLDAVPWYALTDSTSRAGVTFNLDRFWDDDTGWSVHRLGITMTGSFGLRSVYYLRAHVMRFDTDDLPVLTRWPELRGEGAADDWPGTTSPNGLARPELGLMVPLPLPLVGPTDAALVMGLPVGSDSLYPFSAGSWPLRLDVRRSWRLAPPWWLAVQAGGETTFDSSGEDLTPEAFPDGWRFGAEAAWQPSTWRQVKAGYEERRLGGRASRRASLAAWFPLGGGNAVGLVATRELGPRNHRAATSELSLLWRFAGLPRPEAGESR